MAPVPATRQTFSWVTRRPRASRDGTTGASPASTHREVGEGVDVELDRPHRRGATTPSGRCGSHAVRTGPRAGPRCPSSSGTPTIAASAPAAAIASGRSPTAASRTNLGSRCSTAGPSSTIPSSRHRRAARSVRFGSRVRFRVTFVGHGGDIGIPRVGSRGASAFPLPPVGSGAGGPAVAVVRDPGADGPADVVAVGLPAVGIAALVAACRSASVEPWRARPPRPCSSSAWSPRGTSPAAANRDAHARHHGGFGQRARRQPVARPCRHDDGLARR